MTKRFSSQRLQRWHNEASQYHDWEMQKEREEDEAIKEKEREASSQKKTEPTVISDEERVSFFRMLREEILNGNT